MKHVLFTATAAALFLAPITAVRAEEARQPSWLFVQTASGFAFDGTTLTLPYEREIFAFTDRPYRLHAYLNAHELAGLWASGAGADNFGDDAPNAVLTWRADSAIEEAEIELRAISVDDLGRTVTYEITVESGAALPQTAQYASLFIDDSDWFDYQTFCNASSAQAGSSTLALMTGGGFIGPLAFAASPNQVANVVITDAFGCNGDGRWSKPFGETWQNLHKPFE